MPALDCRVGETAPMKIIERRLAFRHPQHPAEIAGRRFQHVDQRASATLVRQFLGRGLRQRQAGDQRNALHRLAEPHLVRLHDEVDDRAVCAASEAVVMIVPDVERRGFLAVERAQSEILTALADQADTLADHLDDTDACLQFIEEALRQVHPNLAIIVPACRRFTKAAP